MKPSWNCSQLSLISEGGYGHGWWGGSEQARRGFDFDVGRIRSQAGIGANGLFPRVGSVNRGSLRPHSDCPCHEVIHQFVKAGLSAQMLGPRTQPVAREPSAYAQLSSLFVGHKPMVRLLLFRCADVARYRLPDHSNSSSPRSLPAVSANPGLAQSPACRAGSAFRVKRRKPDWSSLGSTFLYFIACLGE